MNIKTQVYKSRILIVDDNPVNISLLEQILNMNGYSNVESTTDPELVIPLYEKNIYDLVVLDLNMPIVDGFEVMKLLSNIIEEDYLPVIVITAMTDQDVCKRSLSMGARDFITKPFDHMEVSYRIFNMLEVRTLYKQHYEQEKILEKKVKNRTLLLEKSNMDMIRRLGQASEHRDNETGMHILRMSMACEKLTLAIGLDEQFAKNMLTASPLHDLGKIGIPDNILLKNGKLDDEEWTIMKTHTTIGFDLLNNHASEIVVLAQSIALNHHEKWDGSGYPHGLKGKEIPIEARIASICDVFDALTSVRPYKKAWPVEKVVNYIRDNSGLYFDPEITDLFIQIIPELIELRKKYSD